MAKTRPKRGNNEGCLYKRGRTWYLQWTDEDGKRHTKSARTSDKSTANRILQKELERVAMIRGGLATRDDQRAVEAPKQPLGPLVEQFIRDRKDAGVVQNSIAREKRTLECILATRRFKLVGDLTERNVSAYLRDYRHCRGDCAPDPADNRTKRERSSSAVNIRRRDLLAFFNWLKKEELISLVTHAELRQIDPLPNKNRRERRAFTPDELHRLFNASDDRRLWYMLGYYCGLRKAESAGLRWDRIDREDVAESVWARYSGWIDRDNQCLVMDHGKSQRGPHGREADTLKIPDALWDELMRHKPAAAFIDGKPVDDPCGWVYPEVPAFDTQQRDFRNAGLARLEKIIGPDGEPERYKGGKFKLRYTTKNAKGEVVDYHSLRKTLATRMVQAGVNVKAVQHQMRHRDSRLTLDLYNSIEQDIVMEQAVQAIPTPSPSQPPAAHAEAAG